MSGLARTAASLLVGCTAFVCLVAPIAVATLLARNAALAQLTDLAHAHALSVLRRADRTADEVIRSTSRLLASGATAPCGDENVAIMRNIDLGAGYIRAAGYLAGDSLLCSSYGRHGRGIALGPADFVTSRGVSIRNRVTGLFDAKDAYLVVERKGFAAIISKSLPLEPGLAEDASLAAYALEFGRTLASRGRVDERWIERLGDRGEIDFVDEGHVISLVRSAAFPNVALAALPIAQLDERTKELERRWVPVGLVIGLAFAAGVLVFAQRRRALAARMRSALRWRREEFSLAYQPVVDLRTGRWVGAEALIRWTGRGGVTVSPDRFVAVAEASGQIAELTERVLELVTRDAGALFETHPDFHLAINLSAADLASGRTLERFRRLAQALNAAPHNLIVEATERGLMNCETAREVIRELRAQGIPVAIDDFGTGYSSLAYLENFELDYLKIDKSFVDRLRDEATASKVGLQIIEMAKTLGLGMIAEGVETQAQARFLRERGVGLAQGWLFGRPMAFAELLRGLSEARVTVAPMAA